MSAGVEESPAVAGSAVRLTLGRDIQWAAQDAVAAKVAETGAESGPVVVQDVRTGEILTATTNGFGKRTRVDEFPVQGRGGQGVIAIQTTERNAAWSARSRSTRATRAC